MYESMMASSAMVSISAGGTRPYAYWRWRKAWAKSACCISTVLLFWEPRPAFALPYATNLTATDAKAGRRFRFGHCPLQTSDRIDLVSGQRGDLFCVRTSRGRVSAHMAPFLSAENIADGGLRDTKPLGNRVLRERVTQRTDGINIRLSEFGMPDVFPMQKDLTAFLHHVMIIITRCAQ